MRERHYQTPAGRADIPFFYVYDARALTNGQNYEHVVARVQQDPFLLRSVAGMSTVATRWQLYNASNSRAMSQPSITYPRWTQVPEREYPAYADIRFDLVNVTKATNADGNEISLIGFQGVKRVSADEFGWTKYATPYQYWERPFQYRLDFPLNYFADAGDAPRTYSVDINDGDFELQAIAINPTDGNPLGADPFLVTLYDPSGYNALSTAPCSPRWLNWLQGSNWFSQFPTPTLVYPVSSRIKVEVASLTDTVAPAPNYQIVFQGVERVPC